MPTGCSAEKWRSAPTIISSGIEPDTRPNRRAWTSRLLWFVGLYVAGVAVVGVVAYGLKAMLIPH